MLKNLKKTLERIMIKQRFLYMAENLRAKKKQSNTGKKFLDIGCGLGIHLYRALMDGYDTSGLDIDIQMLRSVRDHMPNIETQPVCGSGIGLPYVNAVFDIVHCRHVIEHICNDSSVMFEINRVLKIGGQLQIGVPNINNLMTKVKLALRFKMPYTDPTHFREYDTTQIKQLISDGGFKISKIEYSGFLPPMPFPLVQHIWVFLKFFLRGFESGLNWFASIFPQFAASIDIIAIKITDIDSLPSRSG